MMMQFLSGQRTQNKLIYLQKDTYIILIIVNYTVLLQQERINLKNYRYKGYTFILHTQS